MNLETLKELLPVLGRAHPMLLHMPIGLLIGLCMMECLSAMRKKAAAPVFLVFLAAASAALVASSGWILHEEPGAYSESSTLLWHERLGIATAAAALLVFFLRVLATPRAYRIMLFVTVLILVPTGHFGAEMTHGKGFLLEPLKEKKTTPPELAGFGELKTNHDGTAAEVALPNFDSHIAPFFSAKCTECHGDSKVKGGLRMDSVEAMLAGGDGGPLFELDVAPDESELLYRMLLPLDDDDHMPPDHKAQPTANEIELIRTWLDAGAPFEDGFAWTALPTVEEEQIEQKPAVAQPEVPQPDAPQSDTPQPDTTSQKEAARIVIPSLRRKDEIGLRALPEARLAELRDQLVHVQALQADSPLLWVDFAAVAAKVDGAFVATNLSGVREHIADLSLARTKVDDEVIATIVTLPQLTRLDLRNTLVSSAGVAQLAASSLKLQELVLSQTKLDDSAVDSLSELESLDKLWLWDAGISAEALSKLREALPNTQIVSGADEAAEALEVESDVEFTKGKPKDAELPVPINQTCPVTDKPVDPQFTVVHDGKVIGFCCPNCPATFQADPAKFLAKLGIDD